ncbi:retroviral-like aspartic protease family protein [Alteraurantiacibacter aquimixticola]|uniref:Peptidase A2 domain-containing protein n=1 Tax=Alteraurantiacibacter aquimixticola TaxID=2489173 RepID=A0A4V4U8F5_9SPHN|nr:retroviral-like aspartic protease family protein [Alteraurantiacibacter aquimixticola]TIX49670.1 hypothetical protein E5222_12660 [Alteraurantiacibacter aquimixticola]
MAWMNFAGALALLASASPTTVGQAEIAASAEEAASEILQMEDERYRRMTVPVSINGEGPFNFMIDTGAQATVLSNVLADQLQLGERRTATLVGMVSRRQVQTAIIPELTLGRHSLFDARAALVEGANIGGADGILGLDSLQDRRVLLDFENRLMEVVHEDDDASNRGYDIVVRARRVGSQLIIARAQLDGVRTAVVVDTGAQGSVGNSVLYDRMRRARENIASQMTDINGVEATGTVRVARSLEFGRAQVTNFPVTFADTPVFAALGLEDEPALVLGMNELRLFDRVAIDFSSRRVLFDLPDGSRVPSRDAFGRLGH